MKVAFLAAALILSFMGEVQAFDTSGKLALTGGVSSIEGSGGGGIASWALIGTYATRDQIGVNAFHTDSKLSDYNLESNGLMIGLYNRLEISLAQQSFDTKFVGGDLGIGQGRRLRQNIFGAKVRLFGDAVLDQDSWLPQVSFGVQFKKHKEGAIVKSLGAKDDSGIDYYLAATKIFLAQSILVSTTVRMTRANELGILGFGGDRNDSYKPQVEGSLGYLVCRSVLAGVEYRTKSRNLNAVEEDNWADIFVAWTPTKNISLTGAYLMLGNIATKDKQRGAYGSLQVGF